MIEDPMDHYSEYTEWMMHKFPERYCNGDDVLRDFEAAFEFERFLWERHPNGSSMVGTVGTTRGIRTGGSK